MQGGIGPIEMFRLSTWDVPEESLVQFSLEINSQERIKDNIA
jgi:hypothetical protein